MAGWAEASRRVCAKREKHAQGQREEKSEDTNRRRAGNGRVRSELDGRQHKGGAPRQKCERKVAALNKDHTETRRECKTQVGFDGN